MDLRELLEKATGGEWTDRAAPSWHHVKIGSFYVAQNLNANDAALIVALHNCADELLNVVEAGEWIAGMHDKDAKNAFSANRSYETKCPCRLCAALRALREKEGKI